MQKRERASADLKPRRNGLTVPLVFNAVLILMAAATLLVAVDLFRRNTEVDTTRVSRFLTMEWNLLQELKAQTDAQLRAKDREIATLRARYQELVARGTSGQDLAAIEEQIADAEAERHDIVQDRIAIAQAPVTDAPAAAAGDTVAPATAPLTRRLQEDVLDMRERIAAADARVSAVLDQLDAVPRAPDADTTAGTATRGTAENAVLDLVDTRTTLRALLSAPAVRRDHPDLLADFDRYLEAHQARSFRTGQTAAYADASASVEYLAGVLDVGLTPVRPADTEAGYEERLRALVAGVAEIGRP